MQLSSRLTPLVLILSILALLAGLWAGLLRLGWALPGPTGGFPENHGPLMVSGFLGGLITLERVVALRRRWMFAAPLLTGVGWILSLALPQAALGPVLLTVGSLGAVVILSVIVRREPALHTLTIAAGALCWLAGNLLWLSGMPVYRVVDWWVAFLVLTITGERLELSRVLRPPGWQRLLFLLAAGLFVAGVIVATFARPVGTLLTGAGLVALAAWLMSCDIARRHLRKAPPLTRYIAVCLYAGFIWLGLGGLLNLWKGNAIIGPSYDAELHSIFIGFVISMIYGHAPIIIPAILGAKVPFYRSAYLNLALLHGSLALRLAGDLGGWTGLRRWGGLLNEISILIFLAMTIAAIREARITQLRGNG